jgi:3-methyl-2-oxobutanoate hydroxymethyltransferase
MPFGSYQESPAQAVQNGAALMQAGAHMVKLEGGGWTAPIVRSMVERGIPVCAHLGFTPQSVHALGGYRIQGREESAAAVLHEQARDLQAAGAQMLILELVPSALARALTASLSIPVIGIGAGSGCSGQVLVLHDMLDITRGKLPRFVRNFMQESTSVQDAIRLFVKDVKSGAFPDDARHGY